MKLPNKYKAIGLMSGTSVDGLDMVCCEFFYKTGKWSFKILHAKTQKYTRLWRTKLSQAHQLSGVDLVALDHELGRWMGRACLAFIRDNSIRSVDIIASHGHTVFHQPNRGFTYQLGNGNALYALTAIPVVNDFRSLDVARGGEGAPLVPMGDLLLFGEYPLCLNVGGIANLSVRRGKKIRSSDICFANMGLNYLAGKAGKAYDRGGRMAASGSVNTALLKRLNRVYSRSSKRKRPSLSREVFEKNVRSLLDTSTLSLEDRLATFCESIAIQIAGHIPSGKRAPKLLVTGGGAFNDFLINRLQMHIAHKAGVVVPCATVVAFKEAIIFALLGILRIRGEVNVCREVTHSRQDSSAGCVIGGALPFF